MATASTYCRAHIRWCIRRDIPEILEIENASHYFPWGEDEFLRVLRERNTIGMVAEHGERVVGFMVYELIKSEIAVLNFAVHPDFRRQGVGYQMAAKLIGKLGCQKRSLSAMVRESNTPGQLFYRAQGFKATEVVREFYEDSGEDMYRFVYSI